MFDHEIKTRGMSRGERRRPPDSSFYPWPDQMYYPGTTTPNYHVQRHRQQRIFLPSSDAGSRSMRRSAEPCQRSFWKHALSLMLTSLLCSVGVIWQLYSVTNDFLSYSMVSEVYMEKLDDLSPPSFSVCFPFIELMDWGRIKKVPVSKKQWMMMGEDNRNMIRDQISSNLTITQIFEFTPNLQDMLTFSQVRKLDSFEISNDPSMIDVVKFVKDDLICYRLSNIDAIGSKAREFRLSSHHLTYGSDPGILLSVSLNASRFDNMSKVVTYLHPHDVYPRGDGDFPFNFISSNASPVFGGSSYIGLTYTKISLYLLPPPFRTSCYDYQKMKLESAYHCVHTCVNQKLVSISNRSSFTTTFTKGDGHKMLSKYMLYKKKKEERMLASIYESCKIKCPGKNCYKEIFSPALVSIRNSSDVTFVLYAMNGPEYILKFKAATSPTGLYVQILSVCGAWLGISCVDVIFNSCSVCMGCKHAIKRKLEKCKRYLK